MDRYRLRAQGSERVRVSCACHDMIDMTDATVAARMCACLAKLQAEALLHVYRSVSKDKGSALASTVSAVRVQPLLHAMPLSFRKLSG